MRMDGVRKRRDIEVKLNERGRGLQGNQEQDTSIKYWMTAQNKSWLETKTE
jgi:hypothetical protein